MIRSAWLTFSGFVMLFGLHSLLIVSLLNGRWSVERTVLSLVLVGLPVAIFALIRVGDYRTAAFVGGFLGLGTLFIGVSESWLPYKVMFLGQALTSFAMLASTLGIIGSGNGAQLAVETDQPAPPTPGTALPVTQVGMPPRIDPNAATRQSAAYWVWKVLTFIPLVLGGLLMLLAFGTIAYAYFADSGTFEGDWGGLGLILFIAGGMIGLTALAVSSILLGIARRHPKVGVGLSLLASGALLISAAVVQYGELSLIVGAWSLLHIISAVGVLSEGSFSKPQQQLTAG